MYKIKKLLIIISLCFLIIAQTGCKTTEEASQEFFCLDTICSITVYGADSEELVGTAVEMCSYYEGMLSKTKQGSDIYIINNSGGQPVEVHDETLDIIKKGISMGEASGGKFDITIGAVSALWDFKSENPAVPDEDTLREAVDTVDYRQIIIEGNKIALKKEGAQLDLGGIAKGYIADRIAEMLIDAGVDHALINLGGNVVAVGEKKDGSPWTIGIERPYSDRSEIVGAVEIKNRTVTTSGVYERSFVHNERTYHHILDPHTGYPAETDYEAVTVEGPIGMSCESDALGTVFLMLGPDGAEELLKYYPDFKVAFIDSEDKMTVLNGMEIRTIK